MTKWVPKLEIKWFLITTDYTNGQSLFSGEKCIPCFSSNVLLRKVTYTVDEKTCFSGGSWLPFKKKIICFSFKSNRNPTVSPAAQRKTLLRSGWHCGVLPRVSGSDVATRSLHLQQPWVNTPTSPASSALLRALHSQRFIVALRRKCCQFTYDGPVSKMLKMWEKICAFWDRWNSVKSKSCVLPLGGDFKPPKITTAQNTYLVVAFILTHEAHAP